MIRSARTISLVLAVVLAAGSLAWLAWLAWPSERRIVPLPPAAEAESRPGVSPAQPSAIEAPADERTEIAIELDPMAGRDAPARLAKRKEPLDDVRLFGQLVDGESGAALAGSVTILPRKAKAKGRSVETDLDGRFELTGSSQQRPFASAEAAGYARSIFGIRKGHEVRSNPRIVRLFRDATLDVYVHDEAGVAITAATVELSTAAYELQEETPTDLDFYSGPDPTWKGTTDPSGRVTIEHLSPRVPLQLSVSAGGWPPRIEPESLTLEPGERRPIELVLGAGATVLGRLEDATGAPIPQQSIWLAAARESLPSMFESYDHPVATTKTDALGRFRFGSVPAGPWWIGPAPGKPAKLARSEGRPTTDEVPALAQLVRIKDEAVVIEIVVRVDRGLYLNGQVLDSAGDPVKRASVHAYLTNSMASRDAISGDQGRFSIGPLVRGVWKVSASPYADRLAPSETVQAEAGTTDLVLTVREAARITGEVVDSRTGERCECELIMVYHDPVEASYLHTAAPDGRIELGGLAPGTYSITACTHDGRIGVCSGISLAAGEQRSDVRVEIAPGARLTLACDGSGAYLLCDLNWRGSSFLDLCFESRKPATAIVPPGTIEVHWHDRGSAQDDRVETVILEPGEQRTLILKAGGTGERMDER